MRKMLLMLHREHDQWMELQSRIPEIRFVRVDTPEELERELPGARAMVISLFCYTPDVAAVLKRAGQDLRWIQLTSAGYDRVVTYGAPDHVTITNAQGVWGPAVAEHAIAGALALARRLPAAERLRQSRAWDKEIFATAASFNGAVVTALGYGSIGQEVARKAKAFDARVIAVNRTGKGGPPADEVYPVTELRTVLSRTNVLVISLPLSDATRKLLGRAELALLPEGAIVVNVGRGEVVDEGALVDALRQGHLRGAALDVFESEPLPADSPLWDLDNVVLTPHVAGFGGAVLKRLLDLVEDNTRRFQQGVPLRYVINSLLR